MTSIRLRFIAVVVGAAMVAAACSTDPNSTQETTTTQALVTSTTTLLATSTTTLPATTTSTTTTITIPDSINGLDAEDNLIDRRVIAIKIDNHVKARPQSALQSADAVFEILVEGGITRFIALFHQTDLDWVGPNRSGRPTDSKVVAGLDGAPFQISGAQGWVKNIYRSDGINVVYDNGTTTFRVPNRPKPHNLFTSTNLIREWADAQGWPNENPGNLFTFGDPEPSDGQATLIEVAFSEATPPTWEWNGEQYIRFHGSTPHEWVNDDGDSGQVSFDTLVIMKMRKYLARNPGGSGTSLPTVDTVGSGDAFIFYNGEVVSGFWERASIEDQFILTRDDGSEMILPPGRVWISLQPDDQPLTWE